MGGGRWEEEGSVGLSYPLFALGEGSITSEQAICTATTMRVFTHCTTIDI